VRRYRADRWLRRWRGDRETGFTGFGDFVWVVDVFGLVHLEFLRELVTAIRFLGCLLIIIVIGLLWRLVIVDEFLRCRTATTCSGFARAAHGAGATAIRRMRLGSGGAGME